MRILLFSIATIFITSFYAKAQNAGLVRGVVQTEDGQPVASATVSLLNSKDSSLVKVVLTESNGGFELQQIGYGNYLLHVTSVGYQKLYSNAFELSAAAVQAPKLVLQAASTTMELVKVEAKKPFIENKIDKMVVNVDASPTNAGNTALEVLEKSPGVSVDKDGNISLKGKQGVMVLIDGKPTYLSGQDLANLLRSTPASQLDQIEIMTQPSAKFDASGNAGILNLRLKKNRQKGLSGSVSLSYVQGRYAKTPNSFNLTYRTGRFNIFTNLSYSYWTGYNEQRLIRKFKNSNGTVASVFDQMANQKFHNNNYSARAGVDFNADKNTTIGFSVNHNYNNGDWMNNGRADILNGNNQLDSFNVAKTSILSSRKNFGANLNLRKLLGAGGRELTADLDYLRYNNQSHQHSDNYNYAPNGVSLNEPFLLSGNLPSIISIYSGKMDYTQKLSGSARLEAGVKSSYVTTDNDAQYTYFEHGQNKWVVDNTRSNRFLYKENINAAYVNYSTQINKWGLQAGLRMENTIARGSQAGNDVQKDSSFKKSYTQLFPSAFVSYALSEDHQFALSYGRRIERPNYQDMNPFMEFLDQYTYSQGNPNLAPQFTHNIELRYNFRRSLSTTINYTATNDIINDILKQNDETKVTFQTKENLAKMRSVGIAVSYSTPVTKWWTSTLFLNTNYNLFEGFVNNSTLKQNLVAFMANASQQFRFAKTWSAELSGFYRTRSLATGMFLIEPMGMFSVGFGKQILKEKGSLKLNITDPLHLQKARVIINYNNIDALVLNKWDNRRVSLTFTYRFSKGQKVQARQRSSSAQEEQNRVGNTQQ